MATDFRERIVLPVQLRKLDGVADGDHQITTFKRAVGTVFNGIPALIYTIRRQWIASKATGRFLIEHGLDRSVYPRDGEIEADYRVRVLAAQRPKTPGETKAGLRIALNTLHLADYQMLELYRLPLDNPADRRWDVFEIRYADAGNEQVSDADVQAMINTAKPPRAKGVAVRYRGALIQGFGMRFGQHFGT